MRANRFASILVLAAALAAPARATAGFTLVTSEPALGGNDSVDWSGLGSLTTPNFRITSGGGTQVNGTISFSFARQELGSAFGITELDGSPAIGASAVGFDSFGGGGASVFFTLTFSQPVLAAGANIIATGAANTHIVVTSVAATDTSGNTQTFLLTNGPPFQGFAGVSSDTADLSSLTIRASGGAGAGPGGIVVNLGLLELDSPMVSAVPEPGGLTLAGIGIVGLLGFAWR